MVMNLHRRHPATPPVNNNTGDDAAASGVPNNDEEGGSIIIKQNNKRNMQKRLCIAILALSLILCTALSAFVAGVVKNKKKKIIRHYNSNSKKEEEQMKIIQTDEKVNAQIAAGAGAAGRIAGAVETISVEGGGVVVGTNNNDKNRNTLKNKEENMIASSMSEDDNNIIDKNVYNNRNNQKKKPTTASSGNNKIITAPTPPMGWMNWQVFRCNINCQKYPYDCINDYLFRVQTDALVKYGYLEAGYDTIHVDDCWMIYQGRSVPDQDGKGYLVPDPNRFPFGMKGLSDYIHSQNVKFGLYTAEHERTCAGFPGSAGFEEIDAQMFASWNVDYLKVDGCAGPNMEYYPTGYAKMGKALQNSGRDIIYSCSWPAYLGSDETSKQFCYKEMIQMGCNLWRNYRDIECEWNSLFDIIEHWGEHGHILAKFANPGHYNDPDMLLIGNEHCLTIEEARTQMSIWCIIAAPLIMGNDLRKVPISHHEILTNKEAIAINQDPLVKQGIRISGNWNTGQIWVRELMDLNSRAVALYNPTQTILNITLNINDLGLGRLLHNEGNEAEEAAADDDDDVKFVTIRDIWEKKNVVGSFRMNDSFSRILHPHDTAFLKVQIQKTKTKTRTKH